MHKQNNRLVIFRNNLAAITINDRIDHLFEFGDAEDDRAIGEKTKELVQLQIEIIDKYKSPHYIGNL